MSTPVQVIVTHDQGEEPATVTGWQHADPYRPHLVTHVAVVFADRTRSTWPVSRIRPA